VACSMELKVAGGARSSLSLTLKTNIGMDECRSARHVGRWARLDSSRGSAIGKDRSGG
jgi:hypothetical protein